MALLEGRRILVTGAARGIGLAAARAMIEEGADVAIGDIDAEALEKAQAWLAEDGLSCRALELDVGDDRSAGEAVDFVSRLWGALDVLVNNAAIQDSSTTGDVDMERWQRVIDIDLTGALRLTQAMLPLLRQGSDPSIINTASTQAFFGQPGSAAYASAKGGLMNLTRCMAIDLGAEGIRVNAVAPGFIDTRMAKTPGGEHEHEQPEFKRFYLEEGRIPLRRPGRPEDCAGAFVFLASAMSLYVTGQAVTVDGGLTATY